MRVSLCLLLVALCAAKPAIVFLMLENRSFDHLFGTRAGVRGGVDPAHPPCNRLNSSDPGSPCITMDLDVEDLVPCDPDHSTNATTAKIYGLQAYQSGNLGNATMCGFVEWELHLNRSSVATKYCDVMSAYRKGLPVLNALADEYVLFDSWHASHPGSTWPNRQIALSGTSSGETDTALFFNNKPGFLFPQKTVLEQLEEQGFSVAVYFDGTPWELFMRGILHNPHQLHSMDRFYEAAANGTLPAFSWMNPRSGVDVVRRRGSNDHHPDHSSAEAEWLVKDVYEALRASPQWNDTVLVLTWDEHGGYWDSVPPPSHGVPAPEPNTHIDPPTPGYAFTRLGIRVPTLVVSPRVPRGLVVSDPPAAQKPFPSSKYEHSSVMRYEGIAPFSYFFNFFCLHVLTSPPCPPSTARKLLGASGFLSARDAWAATFEHVFSLPQPRDTPHKLPTPKRPSAADLEKELSMPVNDLQGFLLDSHRHHLGMPVAPRPKQQRHVQRTLQRGFHALLKHVERAGSQYRVIVAPKHVLASNVTDHWVIDVTAARIRTALVNVSGTPYCLALINGTLGVQLCNVASAAQHLRWNRDSTIRPNATHCLTVAADPAAGISTFGFHTIHVSECSPTQDLAQHFSYYGQAPGNLYTAQVLWGDYTGFLIIVDASSAEAAVSAERRR